MSIVAGERTIVPYGDKPIVFFRYESEPSMARDKVSGMALAGTAVRLSNGARKV